MLKRLSFAVAVLLLLAAVLEGGARFFGPGIMPADPGRPNENGLPVDPLVGWRVEPGVQQNFGVPTPTHINQFGLRSPEFPEEKESLHTTETSFERQALHQKTNN